MILKNNVILITGGSSGLGLAMAKRFVAMGNKVIVCARNHQKLEALKKSFPQIETYSSDISVEKERFELLNFVMANFPDINILINNAAIVHKTDFYEDPTMYVKAVAEIQTNVIAPIHLTKLFLPHLIQNSNGSIINITSGLVFVPRSVYPLYSATKAALHSFTQSLRHQLKEKQIRIIEVLFPAVDTPWHQGDPPKIAISPELAVGQMLKELASQRTEIRIGGAQKLYYLSRFFPKLAFKVINGLK